MKRITKNSLAVVLALSILLCIWLILPIGTIAANATFDNVVINGGAEDGVTGWTANDEWQKVRVSDTEACTGSKSFMAPLYKNHVQTQVVPVEPSTKYCLTWVEKGDIANGAQMVLNLNYSKNMVTTVTDKWVTRSWTFTSGASATEATIQIKKIVDDTSANIYVDNISLVKVENDSLIKNGGAEYGDADWDGYRNINNNPDNVRSGNYSFETTQKGFYMSQDVETRPNTQYCLTFAHKGAASDLILKIDGVWRMDINKNETADWQHAYYNFTSSNSSKVTVTFQKDSASDALVYLDDIRLVEVINDEELIKNNGAEYGNLNWIANDSYQKVEISDEHKNGNYSFLVPQYANHYLSQDISVNRNTEYVLSMYTKCVNPDGKSLRIGVSSGREYSYPEDSRQTWINDAHIDWTKVNYRFNSNSDECLKIYFRSEQTGLERYIDDVSIRVFADINEDGKTDIRDIVCLRKAINGNAEVNEVLDVDFSGVLDIADIAELRSYLLVN